MFFFVVVVFWCFVRPGALELLLIHSHLLLLWLTVIGLVVQSNPFRGHLHPQLGIGIWETCRTGCLATSYCRRIHKMHIPYVHMHGYVGGLCAGRSISIMPLCCLTLTVKVLELATCLSVSATHLEPVFMYKGEVYARYCTRTCTEGKARLHAVNNCWESRFRWPWQPKSIMCPDIFWGTQAKRWYRRVIAKKLPFEAADRWRSVSRPLWH